jgi:hypothetical protein
MLGDRDEDFRLGFLRKVSALALVPGNSDDLRPIVCAVIKVNPLAWERTLGQLREKNARKSFVHDGNADGIGGVVSVKIATCL